MLSSTKRSIAVTGAAVLIIGASAAASSGLSSDNGDMLLSVTAAPHSPEVRYSAEDVTAEVTHSVYTSSAEAEMTAAAEALNALPQSHDITDEAAVTVYVSRSGRYHARSDCSGMKNSTAMDITQAESESNVPCSRCFGTLSPAESSVRQAEAPEPLPADGSTVYVSSTGKYHSRSDCSGMKSCTEMERSSAEAAGHEPCRKCW